MNAKRRKQIEKVREQLSAIIEEERAAMDAMPESLREGEKWDKMDNNLEYLEEADGLLEQAATP